MEKNKEKKSFWSNLSDTYKGLLVIFTVSVAVGSTVLTIVGMKGKFVAEVSDTVSEQIMANIGGYIEHKFNNDIKEGFIFELKPDIDKGVIAFEDAADWNAMWTFKQEDKINNAEDINDLKNNDIAWVINKCLNYERTWAQTKWEFDEELKQSCDYILDKASNIGGI